MSCARPGTATPGYTAWLAALYGAELYAQQFRDLTLIQPRRAVLAALGGYTEDAIGSPKNLLLFYARLQAGGRLSMVRRPLTTYTYQEGSKSASANTSRTTLLSVRTMHLQAHVLAETSVSCRPSTRRLLLLLLMLAVVVAVSCCGGRQTSGRRRRRSRCTQTSTRTSWRRT
jgi:hypothetical protein